MSKNVIALAGAYVPDEKAGDIAAMLRRMADKADAGEFSAVLFVALVPTGKASFSCHHIEQHLAYPMIGAAYCEIQRIVSGFDGGSE